MNTSSQIDRRMPLRFALLTLMAVWGGAGVGQALPSDVDVVYRSEMPVVAETSQQLVLIHGLLVFAPGTWFPAHVHGGSGLYTMVEGSASVRGDDYERRYDSGQSYVQDPGEMLAAGNLGEETARMAVAFVLDPGEELTTFADGDTAGDYSPAGGGKGLPAPEMVHDLDLQLQAPGERLRVVQLVGELEPGDSTPLHSYPGPYLTTVLEGEVGVRGANGEEVFGQNEGWGMLAGESHALLNYGDERARFVATFLLEE